jgi:septum formation protein
MGLENIEVCVSGFEENLIGSNFECAADYCLETATRKSSVLIKSFDANYISQPTILISADTIVESGGEILEKPVTESDAYYMLSSLSNSIHLVHTAVSISTNIDASTTNNNEQLPLKPVVSFVQTTKVKFIELTDTDINAYIATGEPFDKAGGYGIQGYGGQFVDYIEGCYFNVMGLPISTLSRQFVELKNLGKL